MLRAILSLGLLIAVSSGAVAWSEMTWTGETPLILEPRPIITHKTIYCERASQVEHFARKQIDHPNAYVVNILYDTNVAAGRTVCQDETRTLSDQKVVRKLLIDNLDVWIYRVKTDTGFRYMFLQDISLYQRM